MLTARDFPAPYPMLHPAEIRQSVQLPRQTSFTARWATIDILPQMQQAAHLIVFETCSQLRVVPISVSASSIVIRNSTARNPSRNRRNESEYGAPLVRE